MEGDCTSEPPEKKRRQEEEVTPDQEERFPPPPQHPGPNMTMMMPFWWSPEAGMWLPPPPPQFPPVVGIPLALQVDLEHLSDYQRLLRQQLELFAAGPADVECPTQGRKQPVRRGQVGLRCRHCARLPLRQRGRGAVYYPSRLAGLYQAAQNMALSHLQQACPLVPVAMKEQLLALRKRKDQANGGKQYWADGCRALGCIETDEGLRFGPPPESNTPSTAIMEPLPDKDDPSSTE